MEIVVGIEDNDEGKPRDNGGGGSSSTLSSPKQVANPVVYKLVRVEGDGRLVPATDDEVMEVEDFLDYDKSEMCVVADTGQSVGCMSIERSSSGKLRLECSEDAAEVDVDKLNARIQYIEQMLQKVKQEEKIRLDGGSPGHSYVNADSQCSADNLTVMDGRIRSDSPILEIVPSLPPSSNTCCSIQSGSVGRCSRPSEGLMECGSSASADHATLKPDFSILNGEICLDKLSIRELHELFKVTFGRETTVKDKQWLKRRIAMSLTNSCDVSSTSFIVKDNKLVKKCEEDSGGDVNAVLSISKDATDVEEAVNCKDLSTAEVSESEDNHVTRKRLQNHNLENKLVSEDLQSEQRAAKRIRKPTKRYIEELSENDSKDQNHRLSSSSKNMGLGHVPSKSYVRTAGDVLSERTVVTRLDLLGGAGVYIPCVSRVRRSRPKKNIMSLWKFHPIGMGEATKPITEALGVHGSQSESKSQDGVMKSRSTAGKFQQPSTAEGGKDEQYSVMKTIELRQELRPKKADPPSYTSNDNMATVPTAKGGMRRKHHRAWTLVEVMKLVDGVSKCGAGRWSEIKRLAFASYSYRTSVDLKDKWRNLLKASFAQTPADEGINSRKHGAVPIPEQILVKVRELAEMNSHVPPNYSASKLPAGAGSMHEDRPGYL